MKLADRDLLESVLDYKSFVIVTTGRAGTDYLQSLYTDHQEIASTCEKSGRFIEYILDNQAILRRNPLLFAIESVSTHLKEIFAPYTNKNEGWEDFEDSEYQKTGISLYIEIFTELLLAYQERFGTAPSVLFCLKSSIVSIVLAMNGQERRDSITTVLIHVHNIHLLRSINNELNESDRVLVCSRNIFQLISSGMHSHLSLSIKQKAVFEPEGSHYCYTFNRTAFDWRDLYDIGGSRLLNRSRIVMLEQMGSLDTLNSINSWLSISSFYSYPDSRVLGALRPIDSASSARLPAGASIPKGSYNRSVVDRTGLIAAIGVLDAILLAACLKNRILYYKEVPSSKIIKFVLGFNTVERLAAVLFLLPLPTRSEIVYVMGFFRSIRFACSGKELYGSLEAMSLTSVFILGFCYYYLKVRIKKFLAFVLDVRARAQIISLISQ